jgi:uncharacterized membrane protein YfcA
MDLNFFLELFALGILAGFCSGLLGVGGGSVTVPFLTHWFYVKNLSPTYTVHMAVATAMASLLFTCLSSMFAHHKKNSVRWDIVIAFVPGIVIGSLVVSRLLFPIVNASVLALFFTVFFSFSAIQMWRNKKPKPTRTLPSKPILALVGATIGSISSLLGAGGGFFSVPFMLWCNIPLHQAVGTSAALSLPLAFVSSIGYILAGWNNPSLPSGTLGYIYLPALFVIASTSIIIAPIGAKMAHCLPTHQLKRTFAVFLLLLVCYMAYHAIRSS